MAQIIECPACSTRYKINKAIPEAGRNVKCARCAHQWKLLPADALPDDDELEAASPPHSESQSHEESMTGGFGFAGPQDAVPEESHFGQDAPSYDEDADYDEGAEMPADDDWSQPSGDGHPRMSSLSQPVTAHDEEYPEEEETVQQAPPEESTASTGKRSWWQRGRSAETRNTDDGAAFSMPSGAYEVPSDDYEGDTPDEQAATAEETPAPAAEGGWSSRFMGAAWRRRTVEQPPVEEEPEEDPEAVIRETFRSALERTEEQAPAAVASDETETTSPFGSIYDADWNRTDEENDQLQAAGRSQSAYRQSSVDYEDDEAEQFAAADHSAVEPDEEPQQAYYEEDDDRGMPAFLRRKTVTDSPEPEEPYHADHREYGSYDDEDDPQDAYSSQNASLNALDEEVGEFGDKPDLRAGQGHNPLYGDQFDEATDQRDAENDLGLLPDLGDDAEDTDIYGPAPKRSSGLAVAAGWVAYLSLAAGLVLGTINFRQDVMAVLPGTVNLYQMLGYDVAVNKVDFASVDYQWNEIDGRPAIELRGEVVNVTDETVRVPPVLVNVQSSSGANLIAEASVPTDELAPRDSATFTLELVSPPEDVTRIELEFAPGG